MKTKEHNTRWKKSIESDQVAIAMIFVSLWETPRITFHIKKN